MYKKKYIFFDFFRHYITRVKIKLIFLLLYCQLPELVMADQHVEIPPPAQEKIQEAHGDNATNATMPAFSDSIDVTKLFVTTDESQLPVTEDTHIILTQEELASHVRENFDKLTQNEKYQTDEIGGPVPLGSKAMLSVIDGSTRIPGKENTDSTIQIFEHIPHDGNVFLKGKNCLQFFYEEQICTNPYGQRKNEFDATKKLGEEATFQGKVITLDGLPLRKIIMNQNIPQYNLETEGLYQLLQSQHPKKSIAIETTWGEYQVLTPEKVMVIKLTPTNIYLRDTKLTKGYFRPLKMTEDDKETLNAAFF